MANFTLHAFTPEEQAARFSQLVLYVLDKCCDDHKLGATKLNKIFNRADFLCFERTGRPLTGSEYRKRDYGPCASIGPAVLEEMQSRGMISVSSKIVNLKIQKVYKALVPFDQDFFTEQEREIIDQAIRAFDGMTGSQAAAASHGLAWKIHKMGETIPYEAALLDDRPPTAADIETARMLARKLKAAGR